MFLLQSARCDYAYNMALDEALVEAMPSLVTPVLRFYAWTEPAASFGYFQKYTQVEQMSSLRPLVRRPTGGGLVPHDADWTYSLAFPRGHDWYSLSAIESYERVHRWIQAALAKVGISTELAPEPSKAELGQCFVGHEKFDLIWRGQKIAGAAQRRTRNGLLIQGSVQPGQERAQRAGWEKAMCETALLAPGEKWKDFTPDRTLGERVEKLVAQKYSQACYNQKR